MTGQLRIDPISTEERFRQLAHDFGPVLARIAAAYEMDVHRREDLLQEIHVALWRSLGGFKGQCSLRTWLYRVAHNVAITHAMRDRRHRVPLQTLDQLADMSCDANSEREMDQASALARLYELIQRLKPLDRQIIVLYLEDVDAAEIGEVVGLSARNVATKIHRIKKILADCFQNGGEHG